MLCVLANYVRLAARQASSQLLPLPALQSPALASPPSASSPQQPHAVPTSNAPQQLSSIADSELAKEQQATQAAAKAKISVEETLNEIALAMAEKAEKAKARQAVKKRPAACVDRAKDSGEGKHVKIMLNHEGSRWQYLVRMEGHPSKSFVYGYGGSPSQAKKQAIKYIEKQCAEFGYIVPPKLYGVSMEP